MQSVGLMGLPGLGMDVATRVAKGGLRDAQVGGQWRDGSGLTGNVRGVT